MSVNQPEIHNLEQKTPHPLSDVALLKTCYLIILHHLCFTTYASPPFDQSKQSKSFVACLGCEQLFVLWFEQLEQDDDFVILTLRL